MYVEETFLFALRDQRKKHPLRIFHAAARLAPPAKRPPAADVD